MGGAFLLVSDWQGAEWQMCESVAEVEGPACHKGLNHTPCWNCADEALQAAGVDVSG